MAKTLGIGLGIFLNFALYCMEEEKKERPLISEQELIEKCAKSKDYFIAQQSPPFPCAVFKHFDGNLNLLMEIIDKQDFFYFKESFPSEYSALVTNTNLVFTDFYKSVEVKRNKHLKMSAYILNTTDQNALKLLKQKRCKELKEEFYSAWDKINSKINPSKEPKYAYCPELYAALDEIFG